MSQRPVRALRDRVQLVPNMQGLGDKSASEPMSPQESEALAQMAAISGVTLSNAAIRQFLQTVSNSTLTSSIQSVTSVQGTTVL